MIKFIEYFEERTQARELFYHITNQKNLKTILSQGLIPNKLSNFEDDSSDITHSKKAYSGIYVGRNLKELAITAMNWNVANLKDFGIVVIESRGYNQLFMDEDNLINTIPYINKDSIIPILDNFIKNKFENSQALNAVVLEFLNNIKKKFIINKHQRKILQQVLIENAPIILFRGVDKNKNADPKQVKIFLDHYKKTDTESWFREFFDTLSKLRLKFKNEVTEFDLDSGRIKKNITFSGNPKIVGIFRFKPEETEVLYSRLEEKDKNQIIETVNDVVDYYEDD